MHELGTGCVGRVDRSSKIFNPPSPVLSVQFLCVCVRETRCAFIDTEAEVGTLGHLRLHVYTFDH